MFASTASCESFEKAKITRSTPCSMMHSRSLSGPPSRSGSRSCELVVELGGPVVDEPHESDPVLAVVRQLERELLTHVAGADDDRVLRVAGQMPAE